MPSFKQSWAHSAYTFLQNALRCRAEGTWGKAGLLAPKMPSDFFLSSLHFIHFFSPDASIWVPSLTTNCQAKWVTHILSFLYRLAKLCRITYYHSSLFLECKWNGVCSRGDRYQSGRQLIQNINVDIVSVSLSNQCFLLLFLFVSFYELIQILYLCPNFLPLY